MLADWLLLTSVILILILKRKEVDEAHAAPAAAAETGTANPMAASVPTPFPLYPQSAVASYPQSYPQDSTAYASEDLDAAPSGGTNPFDNKGFVASPSSAVV